MGEEFLMRRRDGFTLIEVIVALVVLAFVLLGGQAVAARMLFQITSAERQLAAVQLADDRIDFIRLDPQYDSLKVRYEKTESNLPGWAGATRPTRQHRIQTTTSNGVTDYWKITVEVAVPGLQDPVRRSLSIGAP
jgi:prepilin-type N-terminal cleavage/methylation domain-containing protein